MKFAGENVVPYPVETVWDAILDPQTLRHAVPGCEKIETVGPDSYAMTVTAGVAAVKGTYSGQCELSNLVKHESLVMSLSGSGAPGTVDAKVDVAFTATDGGGTRITYEADATVGGMVGGVGSRMLTSVSKRMAGEFFGNVGKIIDNGGPAAETAAVEAPTVETSAGEQATGATAESAPARAITTPVAASSEHSSRELLMGVGIGAGLVAFGVALGAGLRR
ncbi:hypothetical protein DFQ14_102171 [Halopolyspora algeriensis]|uniref:Carbon monoxide dehydrogenase subunit G n=1 Tax=Halopolyspora algeriensis TaxID=1500506 RepID=A0A368VWY6_9ACTN|nr:carbon monoxide dehydrogenase subunit G [Halopolyspora algeriensis]RCW45870.1 hypothetical protein DFQ14_102171 [Halopolyspora algeriensis]TQM55284.1 hypothetical protein FHU43_0045 [Halopolyspora algeriensis]